MRSLSSAERRKVAREVGGHLLGLHLAGGANLAGLLDRRVEVDRAAVDSLGPIKVSASAGRVHAMLVQLGPSTLFDLQEALGASSRHSLAYELCALVLSGAARMHGKLRGTGKKPRNVWAATGEVVEVAGPRAGELETLLLGALREGPQTTSELSRFGNRNTVRCQLRRQSHVAGVRRGQAAVPGLLAGLGARILTTWDDEEVPLWARA